MKIVDAVIDENGNVQLLQPVQCAPGQRLLVTVVEDEALPASLDRLEGFLVHAGPPVTLEEMCLLG